MNYDAPDAAVSFIALVWAFWLGCLLAWLVKKSRIVSDFTEWFRRKSMPARILVVCAFTALSIFAGTKGGGNAPQGMGMPRPNALLLQTTQTEAASPSFALIEARTNGVVLAEASTNAVVSEDCLRHGTSEGGEWIEAAAPFFRWGTNDIRRLYASPGCLSFGTMRHPFHGDALPNATDAESLVVLRMPLGIVPAVNWHIIEGTGVVSRFWHDALPGGGRVFTWENALLDRLASRPATIQVELHRNGDFIYRYNFSESGPPGGQPLPTDYPAATPGVVPVAGHNPVLIGAQMASAAVEAFRAVGSETNSAVVYRLDGNTATNGVSLADLLATAPLLELRWKNVTGLGDLSGDTDGDGLTDWQEVFLHGTDPRYADTDGDGKPDLSELAWGENPFDADEDGDGVPDGVSAADWAANTLWAANADGGANLVITLNEATVAPATFLIGNLAIPLASPSSWSIRLVPGQMYDFRLHTQDNSPVDISLSPPPDEPMRSMPPRRDSPSSGDSSQGPLWQSPKNALNGPTGNTSGQIAVPKMEVLWVISHDGSHDTDSLGPCLHNDAPFTLFHPVVYPNGSGLGVDDIQLQGAERIGENIRLPIAAEPGSVASAKVILPVDNFRWGYLECQLDAHRKDGGQGGSHCSICEMAGEHIDDISLSVRSPLTLKHDNETVVTFHCEQAGHGSAVNPTILIRRTGTTDWHTLAQSFTFPWTARIAGFFEMKGVATIDGVSVETSPVEVEVRYPCYDEVFSDEDVLSICSNLWNLTKELCTETQRQEVGCWIMLDTETGEYTSDRVKTGKMIDHDGGGRVNLTVKFATDEIELSPVSSGFCYPVATVHTHTPTTNRSSGRAVGPSERDISNAQFPLGAPSAVLDYLPAFDLQFPDATNRIPAYHPIDASTKLWKIDLPDRRFTPGVLLK